jgi:hypothetical protein
MDMSIKITNGDWLPDGRVVAVLKDDDKEPPESINVILGWTDELDRLLQ